MELFGQIQDWKKWDTLEEFIAWGNEYKKDLPEYLAKRFPEEGWEPKVGHQIVGAIRHPITDAKELTILDPVTFEPVRKRYKSGWFHNGIMLRKYEDGRLDWMLTPTVIDPDVESEIISYPEREHDRKVLGEEKFKEIYGKLDI